MEDKLNTEEEKLAGSKVQFGLGCNGVGLNRLDLNSGIQLSGEKFKQELIIISPKAIQKNAVRRIQDYFNSSNWFAYCQKAKESLA